MAPGIVKRKAIEKARARGLEIAIGGVRLGWGRVYLRDVQGGLEGVPQITGSARLVEVAWTFSDGVGDVTAEGVQLGVDGGLDEARSAFDAWRARHPSSKSGEVSAKSRGFLVHDLRFSHRLDGVESESGAVGELALDATRVSAKNVSGYGRVGGVDLRFANASTEYDRATSLFGPVVIGQLGVVIPADGELPSLPMPEKTVDAIMPAAMPAVIAPVAPGEKLWKALERARGLIEKGRAKFASGVELRVDDLTVSTARGTLGPWGARVVFVDDVTSFELVPAEHGDGRKPLELNALIPRGPGKWVGEMKIGPATLAEIGVQEKAFGLVDVATTTAEAKGSLELDPDAKTLVANGQIQLHGAGFENARIADGVVTGIDVGARGLLTSSGDLRSWSLAGGSFQLGKLTLAIDGSLDRTTGADGKPATRLGVQWSVPTLPCADALQSIPTALIPKLTGMGMEGTFGAHGSVGFDTLAPEKTQLEFFVEQKCRITTAPAALSVERFHQIFELRTYDPSGKPGEIKQFGPGTPGWVSYSNISPYVRVAIQTCEDGAFFSHNGFSPMAIRNAIIANLKAGKFALGASTVSMQLAKNVFLDRRKQLSRKVQEAVLTAWLEQSLSKTEILELYLNVIEYGPNLYGIGPASWHYFGRPASDLDPLEATFLVSILPAPVRRHSMWSAGGPGDGYLHYLRVLLKEELRRSLLDEQEYEASANEPLAFWKPGMAKPAPHVMSADGGLLKIGNGTDANDTIEEGPVYAPED